MDSRYKFPDRYIDNRSPSISGIIAGICKGELWLDNWEAPRLAAATLTVWEAVELSGTSAK